MGLPVRPDFFPAGYPMDDDPGDSGPTKRVTSGTNHRLGRINYLLFCQRTWPSYPFTALEIDRSPNRMTHHWFPIKITRLLFLLAASPLYGEDPVPAPPAEAKPVQELQSGTQPAATPTDPGQTTP